MFTGLIEATGRLLRLHRSGTSGRLDIATRMVLQNLELGESIAVNGVCLTVTAWSSESFSVDVSPETLDCTTLGFLRPGHRLNLERALRLSDRLGGHLVSGHVDCIATLRRRYQDHNAVRMEFSAPPDALRYIVEKGSIAIDGISLTVNRVMAEAFTVAVIPHSLEMTTLKDCREGTLVNLETDMIGRYVERFLSGRDQKTSPAGVSLDFLSGHGFL